MLFLTRTICSRPPASSGGRQSRPLIGWLATAGARPGSGNTRLSLVNTLNTRLSLVSLRPRDMTSVSSDHPPTHAAPVTPRNSVMEEASPMEKEKALTEAVSGMLETSEVLEQDKVEGVDKEEWDE